MSAKGEKSGFEYFSQPLDRFPLFPRPHLITPAYLRPEAGATGRPAVSPGYSLLEHDEVKDVVVQQYRVLFVIAG